MKDHCNKRLSALLSFVSQFGLAERQAPVQRPTSALLFLQKSWFRDAVLWLCEVTLPLTVNGTSEWLALPPIIMQNSLWWWQCSVRNSSPATHLLGSPSPPVPLQRQLCIEPVWQTETTVHWTSLTNRDNCALNQSDKQRQLCIEPVWQTTNQPFFCPFPSHFCANELLPKDHPLL